MTVARASHRGNQCIKRSDITQVSLEARGYDNWYITEIATYIKVRAGPYQQLTSDPNFDKINGLRERMPALLK